MSLASDISGQQAAELKRAIFMLSEGLPVEQVFAALIMTFAHAVCLNYHDRDRHEVFEAMVKDMRGCLDEYRRADTS